MFLCIDCSYVEIDSLIVEKVELIQFGGKLVLLDQLQIDMCIVLNLDQGFLCECQIFLVFFNLCVGICISYILCEYFIVKLLSIQFYYIFSCLLMLVCDDCFVVEFKVEWLIFVCSELMDVYCIEQSVDKKIFKVSLKKL